MNSKIWITAKEAVAVTGKAQTTINKFCKENLHTPHVKRESGKYYIAKDFLASRYPLVVETNEAANEREPEKDKMLELLTETIQELRLQLAVKDRQIERLQAIIFNSQNSLPEGTKERNTEPETTQIFEVEPKPKKKKKRKNKSK